MIRQAVRFGLVGLANTAVGYAVILAALAAGFGDYVSNALGYAAGLALGFVLNRNWAFVTTDPARASHRRQLALYVAAFAISYGANLLVLATLRIDDAIPSPIAQLAAMATYTASFFVLCRQVVFAKSDFRVKEVVASSGFLLAIATLVGALVAIKLPVSHDVVWQYWIARQVNHGTRLYAQINEVNPPLWFWMALPIDRLGTWFNVNPAALGQVAIVALSSVCFLFSDRLLSLEKSWKLFFLFNAFALGLIIALNNFAQREQITMIAALPYTLLAVKRVERAPLSRWFALAVGVLAALGIALKHYFIAVPLLLELWLLLRLRRAYRPFRPETLAFVGVAAAYGLAVWLFAPAFITTQLPIDLLAYKGYSQPLLALLVGRQQLVWALCLVAYLAGGLFRKAYFTPLVTGLWVTAGGFLLSYFVQHIGFPYHSMPVTFFLLLALIAAGIRAIECGADRASLILPMLALVASYALPLGYGPYKSPYAGVTNEALAGTRPGSTVYILTSDGQKSWPMVIEGGYRWPSRFMSLWMTPAIAAKMGDEKVLGDLSDKIRQQTVVDLQCNPPETFLIDRIPINLVLRPLHFDFRGYFTENAEARALLSHYRLARTTQVYFVYRRKDGSPIPAPAGCRPVY